MIVGRDDEDARQADALAAAVGITEVAGYLAGGMTSWREEKRPVDRVTRLTVDEFPRTRGGPTATAFRCSTCESGPSGRTDHIPGSVHKPYHDISRVPEGIDPDRPVAVVCGSGQRAAVGASLLQRHGARDVIHVVEGGLPLWQRQGWPVDSPGTTAA